ncbi:restriction endonuclease [Streptomyces sp. NPDC008222]|uniref:restriction endonuclease n=1 Tax=Streptomyces sp. NPDC008222 TaxID=3364820 RepID=UPI0036EF10E0
MELCVTGGPGDQGADVVAKTYVGGVGAHKYVTQAKRYRATKTVGLTDMARFAVTCFQAHEADTEVRVTTSTFTPSRPRSSPSAWASSQAARKSVARARYSACRMVGGPRPASPSRPCGQAASGHPGEVPRIRPLARMLSTTPRTPKSAPA